MEQIPDLLRPLFEKVDFLESGCNGKLNFTEENLYLIGKPIDYIYISDNIELIPYFDSVKILKNLKERVERIFNDNDWYDTLKSNIFNIKDKTDNETAEEILDFEIKQLHKFINDLIIIVQITIPGGDLLESSLELDSFPSILRWSDLDGRKLLSVEGVKSDPEIALQFYYIYKEVEFSTQYIFNFNWDKEAVCYLLIKLASTNKSINRKNFIESNFFKCKNQNFDYNNARKSATSFKSKKNSLMILIDRYFENLLK